MKSPTSTNYFRRKALLLLNRLCDKNLVSHSTAVSRRATEIAEGLLGLGLDVDVDSVEVGGLLHDIGRCRSHGIDHGVIGAEILGDIPELRKYSVFCLTHIGAGLTKEEASRLNLPPRDYLPGTIEEKIVAHADNITSGDKLVDIEVTIEKMKKSLGATHPAVKRVRELNDYIEQLLNQ